VPAAGGISHQGKKVKAAMATSTSTAELVLRNAEGGEHPLNGVCLIGREAECQITLDTPQVSRYHAKLTPRDARSVLVEDLHSTNGTFINGKKIDTRSSFGEDDTLQIGPYHLALRLKDSFSNKSETESIIRSQINALSGNRTLFT